MYDTLSQALPREADLVDKEQRFTDFMAGHRHKAVRMAYRLVGGDEGAAEDVAQDAFIKAYKALDGFRGDAQLSTWFYRILVRQAHNYRRWRGVRQKWQGFVGGSAHVEQVINDPGMAKRISEALDILPKGQREVFILIYLEEFTVVEAAEILGKAAGTIKSHLHLALTAMRRELHDIRPPEKGGEK